MAQKEVDAELIPMGPEGRQAWTCLRILAAALGREPKAKTAFGAMAYSHRKEYADLVAEGKQEETRRRRAEKAVAMISEGKRL